MHSTGRTMIQGAFPELEAAFLAQVGNLRRGSGPGDCLQPIAVLAPNDLLRTRLSRALAESGCPHANIHFLTLRNLAERLALKHAAAGGLASGLALKHAAAGGFASGLALAGFSAVRRHGLELTVAMAAAARELEPKLEYFRLAAQQEGFQRAMLETFRDLKDAGLRPQDVKRAAAKLTSRPDDLLRRKLADVALLWERTERAKAEHKLYDDADLLAAAAEEAAGSLWLRELAHFIVYGFYDLTGSQQQLLEACFSRAPATVYFPFSEEEAWRYARPARDWFLAQGFTPGKRNAEDNNPQSEPSDVLIISAPGEAREVAEIVREILHDPDGGAETARIGILLRSDAGYMELLHETLASAHVNAYFPEGPPISRLPAGRALLDLAGLAGGRLRRAEVMDFVTSAPLKPLVADVAQAPSPVRATQPRAAVPHEPPHAPRVEDFAAAWNALTIEAGIVEGRREWEKRLPIADCRLQIANPAIQSALSSFLKTLFDGLDKVTAQKTWKGFAAALSGLYRALIVQDETAGKALEALDEISGLDAMGTAPTLEQFRALVRQVLEETCPPIGRFERNEPAVVKLMAARGVAFDVVIVPGLVEKSFPQPARQDPILLDAERSKLNGLRARAGGAAAVPLKGRRREEEELLFALAAQSARRRLVLTFPRLDAATARQRVPSYFLLRQVEAATGKSADYAALDRFLKSGPSGQPAGRVAGRFVPMTLLDPAARDRAVSAFEYDLSSFGKAQRDQTPDALLYLKQSGRPFFGRALEAEWERWGNEAFTKYDGVVQSPELLRTLRNRLHDDATPVSPTRLECYAACPFSYLLRQVFELEPVEEPERAATLSPMHRGSLVHHILWQFLSEAVRDNALPLAAGHWPRLEAVAQVRFDEFERRGVTGYPLMWRIEKRRILEELREFLRQESAETGPFRPAHFEVRFGMRQRDREESGISTEQPALLDLSYSTDASANAPANASADAPADAVDPARCVTHLAGASQASAGKHDATRCDMHIAGAVAPEGTRRGVDEGQAPVRFCGKMDRVDVDAAGKRCRVLDYKTGTNFLRLRDGSFHGGQALQLPIYLLGARRVLPQLQPDYAEYFYTSERGKWKRVRFTAQDLKQKEAALKFIVRTILDGIRAGRFFPRPEESDCDRCDFRLACGHGRFLEFKEKADARTLATFNKMAEIE